MTMIINQLVKKLHKAFWSNDKAILRERDAAPSHYLFKIEYFNEFSEKLLSNVILNEFEAGGYKWYLHIHPKGDEENDGEGYISIYLELADSNSLPLGSEVNALFNFFIYDQIQDKYLCLRETREKRFHSMNNRWGVTKFIDLATFTDPSKGYIVNNSSIFGAEVFIIKSTWKGDSLTLVEDSDLNDCKYTWNFDNFSRKMNDDVWYRSDPFVGGDYKWRILLNPKPKGCAYKSEGISVGIELDDSVLPPNTKLFANFLLRVVDQTEQEDHHQVVGTAVLFSSIYSDHKLASDANYNKIADFMSLTRLQDPKMGYLLNDKCIIEAEINVLGSNTQYLPIV